MCYIRDAKCPLKDVERQALQLIATYSNINDEAQMVRMQEQFLELYDQVNLTRLVMLKLLKLTKNSTLTNSYNSDLIDKLLQSASAPVIDNFILSTKVTASNQANIAVDKAIPSRTNFIDTKQSKTNAPHIDKPSNSNIETLSTTQDNDDQLNDNAPKARYGSQNRHRDNKVDPVQVDPMLAYVANFKQF